MVFVLLRPKKQAGSTLENVAEDVLNGLFCHYEPPTTTNAQNLAVKQARSQPSLYTFSQVKQKRSILRTSRLFKRKAAVAAAVTKKKGVTWRDEAPKKDDIDSEVEGCGLCLTVKGNGLEDTQSPTAKEQKKSTTISILTKATEGDKENAPKQDTPKKVLYDDEGNPLNEDGTAINEEASTQAQENARRLSSFNCTQPKIEDSSTEGVEKSPEAPTGLAKIKKLADELDEKETRANTPRSRGEDLIISTRSVDSDFITNARSPANADRANNGTPRAPRGILRNRRPSTPYRHRGQDEEKDGKYGNEVQSPGRMSEITMDEAISERKRASFDMGVKDEDERYSGRGAKSFDDSDEEDAPRRRLSVNRTKSLADEDSASEVSRGKSLDGGDNRETPSQKSKTLVKRKSRRSSASKHVDMVSDKEEESPRRSRRSTGGRPESLRKPDPTPQNGNEEKEIQGPLPPTPRRKDIKSSEAFLKMQQKFKEAASPKSHATDNQIRAEVSSVGMETTTRPIQPNPFLNVPPEVLDENDPNYIQAASSGSDTIRTKKLWKGWKKTVGRVQSIVNDIDEQRLPDPTQRSRNLSRE